MIMYKMADRGGSDYPVTTSKVSLVAAAVAILLAAPLAQAQPVVTGSEISWPDDGWYQVQSADGLTNICEGTRSCQVEPGSYIVINHTTGQRFTHVLVPEAPMAEVVSVEGNTISWPDDGWYQVQSASTYESICQGGLSCTVDDGVYIVINHTTGERFTDIVVNGGTEIDEPPVLSTVDLLDISQDLIVTAAGFQLDELAVVVDDFAFIIGQQTTIQWPDSSWYQVQNADTYASVCNGGAECNILPGSYTVINHSTGERSPLLVPYVSPDDQTEATQLENTSATFPLPQDPDNISTELTIKRTYYSCENGGSFVLEKGNGNEATFTDSFGSVIGGISDKNGYVFDQCRMSLQNGLLPDGTYELNGNLQTNIIYSYGDSQSTNVFDEFSIIGDNGVEYRANGQTKDTDGYDFNYLRSATIADFREKLPGVPTEETISDVTFNYETLNNTTVLAAPWKTLEVNGIVRNAQTGDQKVTITTAPVLSWGSEPFMPFNGSIAMLAEDGSSLYQNANPFVDPEDFWALFADFNYTAANGDQAQLQQESYSFPFGYGELSCFYYRSDLTGRLDCPDNYLQ
ncbi:hypothetical protein [Granulosicoccus antarcticus]|uniref:Uncharacterized protein n=1 Tax=Granulosicoccus antarcticus IMCC3135 TaxID=1192854 RepID=A0A2Z2NP19_9GAMM|nr:hypothetical protein [Granulosicoccus antarcticus]ASJ73222.1 hypothetical protein IMCC3135_15700 [Granulosicoccus antarcticus IMCC3135]